jgi:hypothetical protein
MGRGEAGFGQRLQKSGPKHLGQCEFIEEVLALFLFPLFFGRIDAAPGYDDMNMWVNVINLADGFIAEIVVTLLLVFARELAPWPDGLDGVNEQLMQGRDDLG